MTVDYTFEDGDDARRYLGEIGALWAVWTVALIAVSLSTGGLRALSGIAGLVGIVVFTRPLRRRAAALVSDDEATVDVGFRGGPRERAFRKLAYGAEPLRNAVAQARASSVWFALRIAMLALTVLGFIAVLVDYTS
jgi:hypothetical protein